MAGVIASPVVIDDLRNIIVSTDATDEVKNLFENFDDPFTTGQVARFELFDTSLAGGVTEVLLFDQAGEGAPLTVANFVNYVNDGDYTNSIIHRSVPGFIVQGGGFTVDGLGTVANPADAVGSVPPDAPVQNEFSSNRSNLRGTIAMAKLGGDPDSATSQWFFNLADNSANLDNQNGGFTAFGEVLADSDLDVIDAIASVPTFDASAITGESAFGDVPLNPPANATSITADDDFVRYSSITVEPRTELTFNVSNNSNPQLVTASVNGGQLTLDYSPGQTGTAEITVQATNLVGNVIEDTFSVTVSDSDLVGTAENEEIIGSAGNDILNGGAGDDILISDGDSDSGNDQLEGGLNNDILIGRKGTDTLNGGEGDDLLGGGVLGDTLTGGAGSDNFRYLSFRQSLLADGAANTFDVITDLAIGTDQITGPNVVSAANFVQAGDVATLDEAGIQAVLSAGAMAANTAATFTFASRTFVVMNNGVAGYQQDHRCFDRNHRIHR